ncbi:MAG: D-alanyl-D-alanine carboxypeptidase/D-alanyl-D-alanine-endopeptidase [Pseudomonadota bacterium]
MRRRHFLAGALGLTASPGLAAAPATSLRPLQRGGAKTVRPAVPSAAQLITRAGLGGRIGFAVADAQTGAILESLNPVRPMPPASVAKAVTALYALETLGPGYRFGTRLMATGPITNGVLDGDLVLVGGGDPALDTDGLHALALHAKEGGLRAVTGRLLVHGGVLPFVERIDQSQPEHVGYNPSVNGLNLNFNRVHFQWARNGKSYDLSMDARTERFRPDVATARMAIADRAGPVYTYARDGDVDAWTVARSQLGGEGARWLPVRNPDLYAGDVMRTMLRANGITVSKLERTDEMPNGTVLGYETGAPLVKVARAMLRYSTNLTAEVLGMSATRQRVGRPETLRESGSAMSAWLAERAGARRADFDDHSGLNASDRISAADMVRMLTAPGAEAKLRPVLRQMNVGEGRPISVRAKTGTLNFVSGLAGYFDTPSGQPLAFAIFTGDLDRRDALTVAQRERPPGGRSWARASRGLQGKLIERWAVAHG